MTEKLFEKDYSWCKDEIGQKILEENFRQFNLKTPEERERILYCNFGINVKVGE